MEVNTELHYEYRFLHGNLLITIVKKKGMNNIFQKNKITICAMYPNHFYKNGLLS